MRRITIMGVLLACSFCPGCGADADFEQKQLSWELYAQNWDLMQQNAEQDQQDIDQTQQDPNETEQDRDWPQQENEEIQPEIDTTPYVKLNPETIPLESKIEIKGSDEAYPYEIALRQKGDVVIITNIIENNESREFSLDIKRFKVFWQIFSSFDIMTFNDFYGTMESTADYGGDLTIDVQTEEGPLKKSIRFEAGEIKDKEFNKLLYIITWLVGEDIDVPGYLKPWED